MRYMLHNRQGEIIGEVEVHHKIHDIISGLDGNIPPERWGIVKIRTVMRASLAHAPMTEPRMQVTVQVQQRYRNGRNTYHPRLVVSDRDAEMVRTSKGVWTA